MVLYSYLNPDYTINFSNLTNIFSTVCYLTVWYLLISILLVAELSMCASDEVKGEISSLLKMEPGAILSYIMADLLVAGRTGK